MTQNYNGGGNRSGYNNQGRGGAPRQNTAYQVPHVKLNDTGYVDAAEKVIVNLKERKQMLTTSKIRNLLSMISSLYDEVRRNTSEKLGREEVSRIQYIRLHFAYEAGRDTKVKEFVQEADIFAHLKDIGESKESFILFCRYMEALVAYHRYHGGKE